MIRTFLYKVVFLFLASLLILNAQDTNNRTTKVVLLGTGTPNPDPEHSGCSVAIIVNDTPYIVDFGPGLIRKAAEMSPQFGGSIEALNTENIKRAFLTHLHSDHTVGYPDLILTPWTMGRDEPLHVYGPEGIKKMTENILEAYEEDIKYRLYGLEPANDRGWRVIASEIEEGTIYVDDNVKVEAFPVNHGSWPNAFGFRFTTPDKVIVISGDTAPSENIIKYSRGADILLHGVYYNKGFERRTEIWKKYITHHHTSTYELAEIAAEAKPGVVVLYHILFWGGTGEDLLHEISEKYDGKVIVGSDLMIIE